MNKKMKMKVDITSKEEISFDEFKAWVNGLLYGKGRYLPNTADWKEIKQMMERVVPDVVEMQNPETPFFPALPHAPIVPYEAPEVEPWKPPFEVTCGVNENDGVNIKFGELPNIAGGGFAGFAGFGDGYQNQIGTSDCTLHESFSIGCSTGTILPCPSVFAEQEGTVEESLTALEKAKVLLQQFQDTK